MTSSDPTPKLPMWAFFATDAVLLAAAALIAREARHPLSPTAILSIVACVIVGAIVGLVPLVARHERQKNEALDERQREIEALGRTVASSAEQISIAAGGLHEIAELAQKNLRQAEQLPHKLQEKIAEFRAQLAEVNDAEKEELEKEVAALRATESERLETVSTKIGKATAELAKLEAATQQHLTAAQEALGKLSMGTASAIGKAQAAAEQALAQARTEAARGLGEAAGQAARSVEAAQAAALAALDARLAAAATTLADAILREVADKLPTLPATAPAPGEAAPETPPTAPASDTPKAEGTAHPPKRPRKPRREDVVAEEPPPAETPTDAPAAEAPAPTPEPPPVPAEKISEIAPVAPDSATPFAGESTPAAPAPTETAPPAAAAAPAEASAAPAPTRKRARKSESEEPPATPEEPALDLGIEDASSSAGSVAERVLTSDGATRLLVTAYIGIGNRLFIRGAGPGLSWEKGVPLQFVSIGKWRWETVDATAPVQFKLYKNDDLECTALGAQSLDPGYQQEVTAAF